MEKYDVIVIGAGIGGLISAALLSREGYSVAVFEKEKYAGGLCASFNNGGYTFDAAVDAIGAMKQGQLFRNILRDLGIENRLDLIELDPVRSNIFPDFRVDIPANKLEYKETLKELFPTEKNGLDNLFSLMEKIYEQSMLSVFEDRNTVFNEQYLWIGLCFRKLLDEYLTDDRLKAVLSSYCNFLGLPATEVSAVLAVNTLMHYIEGGAYRIRGGIQNLVRALIEVIELNSGKVFYAAKIEKILTRRGTAIGIITENGRGFNAKNIISNTDLKTVINTMVDKTAISSEKMERLNDLEVSGSFVIAYLGAKIDLSVHDVTSSMGYFSSYEHEDMLNINTNISYGLSIPSLVDESTAPEGCHTFIVHWPLRGNESIDKEKAADMLTGSIDNIIPGFAKSIKLRRVADAKTFFRYTGNSSGAAYGWSQKAGFYLNLPVLREIMENFHVVGHWAGLGGGILPAAISALKAVYEITKKKI